MRTARGTKWSASSALYAYGSPWRMPHTRRPRPTASTPASSGHAQRRGVSAVGIDRVVAAGVDGLEAGQRNLVAGVVADVDDRLEEDRAAERVHGHAAAADAILQAVRAPGDVGARLAAGDDVALADAVEDPARVGDQLVVRQRQQRAAPQSGLHGAVVKRRGEALVQVLVVGERGAQVTQAHGRRGRWE